MSSPTFVGRAAELELLDAALERAAEGRPAFVFLAGESGVGKTRLLGELVTRARARDARVLLALPLPTAYARYRAGEALVAAGDRAGAAGPLRAAAAIAEETGAALIGEDVAALARRARIELTEAEQAEAPAPDDSPAARLGLTPRELEVLLLVVDGLTNRAIGETLFMSEKTASVHVSRILAKLGVGGRVEAAAVAHRLGLTGAART